MLTKKTFALNGPDCSDDSHRLIHTEGTPLTLSTHRFETPPLDTELPADALHLASSTTQVTGELLGVDAGGPVIHNAFWIPGKVPSLNDLLKAKSGIAPVLRSIIMRERPRKGKRNGARFDLYNDIKQDWKQRTVRAIGTPFVRVRSCYFGYLVIEETLKRDPSNFCSAAVKFIEDGLIEAGVIPNDGWDNVLGIRVAWAHRKDHEPGVYVVMSEQPLHEARLLLEYCEYLYG